MQHSTRKIGNTFTWLGWIIGFFMLALLFDHFLNVQNNPNQSVNTITNGDNYEIVLQRNRSGHYLVDGKINGQSVTFFLDTGATTTAIPAPIARRLGLKKGLPFNVQTANGTSTAFTTRIDSLQLGLIEFTDISASINPGFNSDEILLGMNILKNLELLQRGDTLIIRSQKF